MFGASLGGMGTGGEGLGLAGMVGAHIVGLVLITARIEVATRTRACVAVTMVMKAQCTYSKRLWFNTEPVCLGSQDVLA